MLELRFVLVDMRGVNDIDVTGLQVLSEMCRDLGKANLQLLLCNLKNPVIQRFFRASPLLGKWGIPENQLFLDISDAVDLVKGRRTAADASEDYTDYLARNFEESPCHSREGSPHHSPNTIACLGAMKRSRS